MEDNSIFKELYLLLEQAETCDMLVYNNKYGLWFLPAELKEQLRRGRYLDDIKNWCIRSLEESKLLTDVQNHMPKYLYHYTKIETLTHILKTRKIRFNNLSNVDDLLEGHTLDCGEIGKYFFTSCWSEAQDESIPLWQMYADGMRGVRICLPKNPFKRFLLSEETKKYIRQVIDAELDSYTFFEDSGLLNNCYLPLPPYDIVLKPITYTNEESILKPKILHSSDNRFDMFLTSVGSYKMSEWMFQAEWRYSVSFWPFSIEDMLNMSSLDIINLMSTNMVFKHDLPFKEYFMTLDDILFEDMKILMGPATNEEDRAFVASLVKEYNPKAEIFDSVLKGKIRL